MRTRQWTALVAVLAVGLTMMVGSAPATAADTSAEQQFVARVNALRDSKGLPPLQVDDELVGVARHWTDRMVDDGQISHNPNLANDVQADWTKLGENVGVGGDVDSIMQAFINSPSHYRNLVDPAYNYIGVGVSYDAAGRMYTTHDFMSLHEQPIAPTPEPQPLIESTQPTPPPAWPPPPPAAPRRVKTMLLALRSVDL